MNLSDRKAFALRAAYLSAIGNDTEIGSFDGNPLALLESRVKEQADAASKDSNDHRLDLFLDIAVDRIGRSIGPAMNEANAKAFEPVLAQFKTAAGKIRCSSCENEVVCRGAAFDDAIVASSNGGLCIHQIKAAFNYAMGVARNAYPVLPAVTVTLSTTGRSDYLGQVPGLRLAMNGRTRFYDDSRMASGVDIEVASSFVDSTTMAAIPYIAVHEVLCHAYQMAGIPGVRKHGNAVIDPISEGLMDAVAVDLLQERANAVIASDTWPVLAGEADIANQIHLARRSLAMSPRFPQAASVYSGSTAWALLCALFAAESSPIEGKMDARRFACSLNAHPWSYAERLAGISKLVRMLGPHKDLVLIDHLLRYKDTSSVDLVVEYLTKY